MFRVEVAAGTSAGVTKTKTRNENAYLPRCGVWGFRFT